jgi:HAD superfamily hydrolase (TIGR01549 family)
VRSALEYCGRTDYTQEEFDRFFRRVYQHYGSLEGYEKLPDAIPFLDWLQDQKKYSLGVTTNTPVRTVETVLPMNGFHEYFQWFLCSQDIGVEKPSKEIFDRTYERALFWTPDLKREEILHIGDSMEADFCGAKAAGFQALLLDRSDNPRVTVYQDWLEAPSYPGKSEGDIALGTVKNLLSIIPLLEDSTARFG